MRYFPGVNEIWDRTLVHHLPLCLHLHLVTAYGGFKNRRLIEFYKRYVTVLFERYKGQVHYWLTFNEINDTLFPSLYSSRSGAGSHGRQRHPVISGCASHSGGKRLGGKDRT